jgi:hypothetical protein
MQKILISEEAMTKKHEQLFKRASQPRKKI